MNHSRTLLVPPPSTLPPVCAHPPARCATSPFGPLKRLVPSGLIRSRSPRWPILASACGQVTPLTDIPGEQLTAWTSNPSSAPHGGESILGLVDRVRGWLDTAAELPGRTIAITHPAVIRAALIVALNASPASFWRIDVPPLTATTLHAQARGWTLRYTCLPLRGAD